MSNLPPKAGADLYLGIREVFLAARTTVRRAVNETMVQAYWQIGRLIVEDEQGGEKRAEYGKAVLPKLAACLSAEFGKGFSAQSLWSYRRFYLEFPILSTAWRELHWSHFRMLMRVKSLPARAWYADETAAQGWSVRALDRQISTLYYERLLGSQKQDGVREEAARKLAAEAPPDPHDFIRDPYVLEFLGVQPGAFLYEQEVEQALIDRLQQFLMELGKGFAFVARQKRLQVEGDNPTIGLILCSERNSAVAKYSALADKPQLFASRYKTLLPSEEELRAELERDRALLENSKSAEGAP